jgi:hypothetical protein
MASITAPTPLSEKVLHDIYNPTGTKETIEPNTRHLTQTRRLPPADRHGSEQLRCFPPGDQPGLLPLSLRRRSQRAISVKFKCLRGCVDGEVALVTSGRSQMISEVISSLLQVPGLNVLGD